MQSSTLPICLACVHYTGHQTCPAFKDEIPVEIWHGGHPHSEATGYEDAIDGVPVVFELKPGKEEAYANYKRSSALISKFNPNHDELGRFSSADGALSYTRGGVRITDYSPNPPDIDELFTMQTEGEYAKLEASLGEILDVEVQVEVDGAIVLAKMSAELPNKGLAERIRGGGENIQISGTLSVGDEGIGEVLGYFEKDKSFYAHLFVLDDDYQKKGIATALLAHWEDQLYRSGVRTMNASATSNKSNMNGGYTWLTLGFAPNRPAKLIKEYLYSKWEGIISPREVEGALANGIFGGYKKEDSPATQIKDASRAYEAKHGADMWPLLLGDPEFVEYLKTSAKWKGAKALTPLDPSELSKKELSSQLKATISICNKWMRENPAGLENDDPKFFEEIKAARNEISKFNPNHDELGRFSSASSATVTPAGATGGASGGGQSAAGESPPSATRATDPMFWGNEGVDAKVTQTGNSTYNVQYGDLSGEVDLASIGVNNTEEALSLFERHWVQWAGNYRLRHASAGIVGLPNPSAAGGEKPWAEDAEGLTGLPNEAQGDLSFAIATGEADWASGKERDVIKANAALALEAIKSVGQSEENAPILHKGLSKVASTAPILNLPLGGEYRTPLTAFSSAPFLATNYLKGTGNPLDNSVMLVLKPGSKAHASGVTKHIFPQWTPAVGWEDSGGMEYITQGGFRVVDRFKPDESDQYDDIADWVVVVEQTGTYEIVGGEVTFTSNNTPSGNLPHSDYGKDVNNYPEEGI